MKKRRLPLTRTQRSKTARWVSYGALFAVFAVVALFADWPGIQGAFFDPSVARDQFPEVLTGALRATLIFSALGFALAFVLGLLLSAMRLSSVAPYRWIAIVYIDILRGVPALVTILIVGFGIPLAFGVRPPGDFTLGSIAIGLVGAAYIAETLRAGIQAVPRGQIEAARSLGMSPLRTFLSVTLPQALKIVIPPLTNEMILLIKDTSLLSILGVTANTKELTKFGRDGAIEVFNSTPLTVVALVYLAMIIPLTLLSSLLERKLSTR